MIAILLVFALLVVLPTALIMRTCYWQPSDVTIKRVPWWLGELGEEDDEAA